MGTHSPELWKRHPIRGPPSMAAFPHVLLVLPLMLPTRPSPPCQAPSTVTSWGSLYHRHTSPVEDGGRLRDQEPQSGISLSKPLCLPDTNRLAKTPLCQAYTSPPLLFLTGVHRMASGSPLYRWVHWGSARRKDLFKAMA